MEYKGIISGIGDSQKRENEISSDDVAILRNFIVGYDKKNIAVNGGILTNNSFLCEKATNTSVIVSSGMAFAYGYFGYYPQKEFSFYPPAVTQYHIIYAEFDKSQIPNQFEIKSKNNQSTPYIRESDFRRDVLSSIKTGVFQLPLWKITVSNEGIKELTDLRNEYNYIKKYIDNVVNTNYAAKVQKNGHLQNGVTCETAADGDISTLIANTEFVSKAIKNEINK